MVNMILFPSSFYNIAKVDEALQQEYDAAKSTGLFDIALWGYDKWLTEDELVVKNAPDKLCRAVYRGWMLHPEKYRNLYNRLIEYNIQLVTTPEEYELMHIFPNAYKFLSEDTAKMKTYPLHEHIDVERLKKTFQRFMVKDFVKSVKGSQFPKFFDQSVTQEEFDKWMDVFYKYRGKLLIGGICIKEYLNLKKYGSKTNEFRVFYINHEPATITRNSGQGSYTPTPPKRLVDKYATLSSPYYTIDYAELSDESWVVIEAGDGGVSGLSENQNYEHYFRALYQCFK